MSAPGADVAGNVATAHPYQAYQSALESLLRELVECEITLVQEGQSRVFGTPSGPDPIRLHVRVHDPEMFRRIALGGSVGVAEAYMEGQWTSDDLVGLVRIFLRNRDLLDRMETGVARIAGTLLRFWHSLRRNTAGGSKKNIAAHYDLGNPLFKLFLDDNLMYSSALYADPSESLEVASRRKLDRICQKLDLQPGDRVMEIGTGWGGFALHAAQHYGCHITTTTISAEQHDLAAQRIGAAGLADRVTLLKSDYRALTGKFDKLVSIEMIEAIGHQYLGTYFGKIDELLTEEGAALIQAITIEDYRYERALTDIDFIKRHIFPGSFIPSVGAMCNAVAKSSRLRLINLEDIGDSYALTLREWRKRFLARLPEVRALGYPERFVHMWDYYLAYCEGGFMERTIGDVQMLLAKPRNRRAQFVPAP